MSDEDYSVSVYAGLMSVNRSVFSTIVFENQAPLVVLCRVTEIKGRFHFVDFCDPDEALADLYYSIDEDLRGPWKLHIADDRVLERDFDPNAKPLCFVRGVWYGRNQRKNTALISLPSEQRAALKNGTINGNRSALVTPQAKRGSASTLSRGVQK